MHLKQHIKIGIALLIHLSWMTITPQGLKNTSTGNRHIIETNIKQHLHYLGSDIFEGRGTGTLGGELAAKYLALRFDELNLIPIGDNNTYYQKIPMHGSMPSDKSELMLFHGDKKTKLELFDEYVLFRTGEQTYIPTPLSIIFAGYGINAPEYDYNDYNIIDVEGKIVLILDGEPISNDPEYFDGELPTIYSYPESKIRTALARGAYGCIIIPNRTSPHYSWDKIIREFQFEDVRLAYSSTGRLAMIINPEVADTFFAGTGYNLEEIFKMQKNQSLSSLQLDTKLSFRGYFNERDFFASNIIGMIKGNDEQLENEYIILSAHYDHLGKGPAVEGDSIYNGVLDNALGVSLLLELAREFKKQEHTQSRSLIFLLVTGEEKGLLGSTYYTENPIIPLYKTIANINIDGVAVFDTFKSITGIGIEYSSLEDYFKTAAASLDLEVKNIPTEFEFVEAFYKSDQLAFARGGIPSVITMEGLDYQNISRKEALDKFIEYGRSIYHSPFDDLSIPINYDAVIQHYDFIFSLCSLLADSPTTPEWKSGSPYINARLRSIAEKK